MSTVQSTDPATAALLRWHYTATRDNIARAIDAYESATDLSHLARAEHRPEDSGRYAAYADLAGNDWTKALGAAAAIEALADALGVVLADDRRRFDRKAGR